MAGQLPSDMLLIIGAGVEQLPLYRRARELGLSVVGTDVNPGAPALRLADHSIIASTRCPVETIEGLQQFEHRLKISGVITMANDVPRTVATVARHLGLPGMPTEIAEVLSDKFTMKSMLTEGSIPTPRQWRVGADRRIPGSFEKRRKMQFVVKPVDGRGSLGVLIARDPAEIPELIAVSAELSQSTSFVIEEYIPGAQYSVEGIVVGSRFFLAGIAERNYDRLEAFSPHVIEDGGDISHDHFPDDAKRFSEIMQAVSSQLNLESGILKGDLVVDSSGTVQVIEVAGRLSGGWFASHQIPYAYGVDLMGLSIRQALGERVSETDLVPSQSRATSIRYWFPPPGRIESVSGLDSISQLDGVLHYGVFRQEGEIQPPIKKHSDRFGFVLTGAEKLEEARRLNAEAMSLMRLDIS